MIAELVHLLLSILIWFVPSVGTKSISLKSSLRTGELPGLAIWIPLIGWVAVSVKSSAADDWLPQRVVSAQWLGRFALLSDGKSETRLFSRKHRDLQAFICRFWRQTEKQRKHSPSVGQRPGKLDDCDSDSV